MIVFMMKNADLLVALERYIAEVKNPQTEDEWEEFFLWAKREYPDRCSITDTGDARFN